MDSTDDDTAALRDSARDYLAGRNQRQRVRQLQAAGGGFDAAVWREIAALGWLAIGVPEAEGGLGLGIEAICAITAEVGMALLPEPLVDAGVHPVLLLARLPHGEARDALLARLTNGEAIAGVAWQERAGELEVERVETRAECVLTNTESSTSIDCRLSGLKTFVRPGPGASGWIVSARDADGPVLAWVEASAAGIQLTTEIGVDGSAVARLQLTQAPAQILARGAAVLQALADATELARLAQAAELAGLARRALDITADYLRTREQFGKPIGSFQALQHRLVDGLIQVELAEATLREVLGNREATGLPAAASRAKARCAHAATEMTRLAIQLHGAIGTTNEADIGLYFKRAMALSARWGQAGAHRQRHARLTRSMAAPLARAVATQADFSPDQDWAAMPEAVFRETVRALFAAHYPEHRRFMPYRQTWAESREWYLTLSRLGWIAPAWPRAHGGLALPADKLIAYIEESEAWGVARCPDQGLVMVGPILMRFGTEAQRQRFLPPILAGEHVWTQGYSEPNAGSDLAAVRTEAVIDGDHFVVTGQKIWTTWGADGTHMFMLVRTDKTVKKQAGISFLLVDLKSPGITVRPIENIAGEREFCEVFFDQVRVPRDNLVGELNQGWTVAKALLGFERLFTGSPKHSQHTLRQVERLAAQRGLLADAAFAARLAELRLDTADLGAAYARFADMAKRGEPIPPSISMLKIWSTETWERLALLLVEAAQDWAALRDHCRHQGAGDDIDLHVVAPLFNVLGAKIFAGSNEIQRNILAKSVLDLPG